MIWICCKGDHGPLLSSLRAALPFPHRPVEVSAVTPGTRTIADPTGIRPLYAWSGSDLAVVSRFLAPCVVAMRSVGTAPAADQTTIEDLVTFGTPLGRGTMVEGVQRLHPGEIAVLRAGAVDIEPPELQPIPSPPRDDEAAWIDAYLERLWEVLQRGLDDDDTPEALDRVGCALSGGLDSRTLATMLSRERVPFTAVTFGRPLSAEWRRAGEVASHLGVPHLRTPLPADGPLAQLDLIADITGGTGSLAYAPGTPTHELAARHVDVLISGASGDALFGDLPGPQPESTGMQHYLPPMPPLRVDRRALAIPWAPSVERRIEQARLPHIAGEGPQSRALRYLLRWRQATTIADGVRLRDAVTRVITPFLEPEVVALARDLPPRLRTHRTLQRHALRKLDWYLADLPLVPSPPWERLDWYRRAGGFARGRVDHLLRNLWLRGTPDREAIFDVHTAFRLHPQWLAQGDKLCADPPPGVDPEGLRTLWTRHRMGRDNLGRLFGRLLVAQRFLERWVQ